MKSRAKNCVVLLASVCLIAALALGQVRSSTITGTVTDPSGAVIPDAKVTVTNEETNVVQEVRSNAVGDYVAPYMASGRYSVAVEVEGFNRYLQTGIVMGTGSTVRVNASLTPGSVATSVEVTADAAVLQSESSTVQSAVNENIISSIPNINNNPLYYASLQAGVVPSPQMYNGNNLGVGFQNRQQMSAMRINGGQMGTNDVQLDGISVRGAAWHETTVVPNRDALQEVRVVTNNFSAELGGGQGLISMITKSGTNELHGSLHYRIRNEALNANGLANNQQGVPRNKYRLNEGGGSVGGPVLIPKFYDGRNKLFFFFSFQRLTHSDPVTAFATVPTALEREGNFSQTMVAGNAGQPVPVQIFNPFSAVPYQGSNVVFERMPYANSIIANPDPFGARYLQAYPLPNHEPIDAFNRNNYYFEGQAPTERNSLAMRVDYHLNPQNNFYFTAGRSSGAITQPNRWGPDNPFVFMGWPGITDDANPYAAIGDTISVSPTTVLDIRYGVTRINTNSSYPAGEGFDYTQYGLPASVQSLIAMYGTAPSVRNFGGPISNLNNDGWARKRERQLNHALVGSVTKIVNRWTLKAGGEYRVYLGNWQDLLNATPMLTASNHNGQLGGLSGGNSNLITDPALRGISFASALTGVTGFTLQAGTTSRPALTSKYAGLFTQNDWKVTDKLTINLGLRWELQPGPTERFNHASGVDLGEAGPYTAGLNNGNPLAPLGKIAFVGVDGYSRNLWDTDWKNFSPRIGAAYRFLNSMVLRGGFGRTFAPSNTGFNANGLIYGTGPFSGGAQAIPYGLSPNGVPIGRFSDPGNTLVTPAPGAVQSPTLYGNSNASLSVDLFPRNYKNTRVDQWNVFVERSIGRSWLVSAGYLGARGADLPWRGYPLTGNFTVADSTLQGWRDTWVASNGTNNPAAVQVNNPLTELIGRAAGPINGAKITTINSMQPYLALLGQTVLLNEGTTNYHALQLKVDRAYSNGLQTSFNYTWSKSTGIFGGGGNATYAESQVAGGANTPLGGNDYRNLENNAGYLGHDVPHRFVAIASYLTPTGAGQALDPGNKFARALIGEWQFATAITVQSGQPWGPSCGGMNGRCERVPGEDLELPENLQGWYDGKTAVTLPNGRTITPGALRYLKWNPDAFSVPIVQFPNGKYQAEPYYWGSTSKYVDGLRSPGFYNVNLTVNRKFTIVEGVNLEFLAEATNLLNQTVFNPSAINGSVSPALVADTKSNTKVGQNSNVNFGSMGMTLYQPRQVTFSLRLRF